MVSVCACVCVCVCVCVGTLMGTMILNKTAVCFIDGFAMGEKLSSSAKYLCQCRDAWLARGGLELAYHKSGNFRWKNIFGYLQKSEN